MTDQIIHLNPIDPLAHFEHILRTTGGWCHVKGQKADKHYFVAKNPKAGIAISLCMTQIVPLEKLSLTTPEKRCLVCDLFAAGREENKQANLKTIETFSNDERNLTQNLTGE